MHATGAKVPKSMHPAAKMCTQGAGCTLYNFEHWVKVRQHLCRAVSRNSRFLTMYNRVLVMYISI